MIVFLPNQSASIKLGSFACKNEWEIKKRVFYTDDVFKVVTIDEFFQDYTDFEPRKYRLKFSKSVEQEMAVNELLFIPTPTVQNYNTLIMTNIR